MRKLWKILMELWNVLWPLFVWVLALWPFFSWVYYFQPGDWWIFATWVYIPAVGLSFQKITDWYRGRDARIDEFRKKKEQEWKEKNNG
jgi:hypothetical protein